MALGLPGRSRMIFWLALPAALIATAWFSVHAYHGSRAHGAADAIETTVARRLDLKTELVAGGDMVPAKETSVACQVEDLTKSSGTLIVSIIENGTRVKKGDELCRLDSTGLEDLARQEELDVNQARATCEQARLTHEVAVIELREYQDGLIARSTFELEGQIALARANKQGRGDRLAWARTMLDKGYVSKAELSGSTQAAAKAEHQLRIAEIEFHTFKLYQAPKQVFALQSEIAKTESVYRFEAEKLKVQEQRLAYIRKQIANCRVVAPHDGSAMHGNRNSWRPVVLEPGVRVKQDQELFTIPDLSKMDVEVSVHETMGHRVRVGQAAVVSIASRPGETFAGRVASMSLFPVSNEKEWDERLKHYLTRVRLDETPSNVFPLMSATVRIDTGRVADALVVPVGAVSMVGQESYCYVVVDGRPVRRAIATGRSSTDLLEITSGLSEGDRVALGPIADDGTTLHP